MRKLFHQKGFTLTEIIIVVAIFSLIIVTVFSIYILNQQAYIEGEIKGEIIQNGRVILERMSREIRQARGIVTQLPEEKINPPSEIKFHDGHLPLVSETNTTQGGSNNTVILASAASSQNDYYKDMFVKIIEGTGVGQVRKIISYDGTTKTANIEGEWETIPNSASTYKIDTSFYYIYYYLENNNILRKVVAYCFSSDSSNCVQPETYISWNAVPPSGETLLEITLEQPRAIGEYISNLEFWGSRVINIFLGLEKKNKNTYLEIKIFGRNL